MKQNTSESSPKDVLPGAYAVVSVHGCVAPTNQKNNTEETEIRELKEKVSRFPHFIVRIEQQDGFTRDGRFCHFNN